MIMIQEKTKISTGGGGGVIDTQEYAVLDCSGIAVFVNFAFVVKKQGSLVYRAVSYALAGLTSD